MTDVPVEHLVDASRLTQDREVSLWEITLRDGSHVYIRNGPAVTWQGKDYEELPIIVSGEAQSADDQTNRPSLRVFNPKKIFGPMAHQGKFELATVRRRLVLQEHLVANANIFVQTVWIIGQISSCTSRLLEVQLRSPTDGPNMNVPYRFYSPPDFPTVTF